MTEPFSSCVDLAGLQNVDRLGEFPGAPGGNSVACENPPRLELRVRALAGRPEFRVRPVGLFLRLGLVFPGTGFSPSCCRDNPCQPG